MTSEEYVRLRKKLFLTVILTSLISVAIFAGIGFFLDYFLQTRPLFIILSLLISFITTNIFLSRRAKQLSSTQSQN